MRAMALAALALSICAPAAAATAPGVPALSHLPWDRLRGDEGRWVRYRVHGGQSGQASFMTMSVVEVDAEAGRIWVEVRVAGRPEPNAPGVASRVLLSPAAGGGLSTERMIVSFNGGAPLEVDVATLPDEAEEGDAALSCTNPESEACRRAAGGPELRALPEEGIMTAIGSLTVRPIEVRTAEGTLYTYLVSERVPVTGLVIADLGMRGRMELDGVGEGARATVGAPVRKVSHGDLAKSLAAGTPAFSAIGRIGEPVNPDERRSGAAP